jgi:hypothetical protein
MLTRVASFAGKLEIRHSPGFTIPEFPLGGLPHTLLYFGGAVLA